MRLRNELIDVRSPTKNCRPLKKECLLGTAAQAQLRPVEWPFSAQLVFQLPRQLFKNANAPVLPSEILI